MATLYFSPSRIELPAIGETFDVAIKYRETLSNVEGFWLYVLFDTDILYYHSTISVIQDNPEFNDTRFGGLSNLDPRSGVVFTSGNTPTTSTPFNPLISGTDLTLLTFRMRVERREATTLQIATGRTPEGFRTSQIYVSTGHDILEPTVESATLTVDGSSPTPTPVPPTPTGLSIDTVDTNTLRATWNTVPGATYYEHKIATSVQALDAAQWTRTTQTSVDFDKLTAITQYFVVVRSGNSAGPSNPTTAVSGTTAAVTPTPNIGPDDIKAYEERGIYLAITLAGASVPVSEVAEISEINTLSDSAETGSFKSGETRIILNDPDGDYNIAADENFFTRNGYTADGSGAPFSILAGYDAASHNIFEGVVDNIIYDSVNGSVTIVVLSLAQVLLQEISDFGLPKRFRITQESAQQAREARGQGDHRENGVYPVLKALLPPSQDSETLHISLSEQGNKKEALRTEGTLNNRNFSVSSEGVETEGSALGLTGSRAAFPQLEMKSPHRWEYFKYPVAEILEKFGINNPFLAFYPTNVGEHFAPVLRPYYDLLGNTGSEFDVVGSWNGFCTDWQRDGNDIYFLYSIHHSDQIHKSRILKYDLNAHEWSFVHSFAQGKAAWQIAVATDASDIFVVTRDNRDAVSDLDYDSLVSRANSTIEIQKISFSEDGRKSVTVVANNGSPFRPQLAHYYHVTGAYGMLPDTRGGFTISHGHLIYRYTRGTDKFGICAMPLNSGVTRSLVEATTDEQQNHAGVAFSVRGNILTASFTWRDGINSAAKDYAYDLSTL